MCVAGLSVVAGGRAGVGAGGGPDGRSRHDGLPRSAHDGLSLSRGSSGCQDLRRVPGGTKQSVTLVYFHRIRGFLLRVGTFWQPLLFHCTGGATARRGRGCDERRGGHAWQAAAGRGGAASPHTGGEEGDPGAAAGGGRHLQHCAHPAAATGRSAGRAGAAEGPGSISVPTQPTRSNPTFVQTARAAVPTRGGADENQLAGPPNSD